MVEIVIEVMRITGCGFTEALEMLGIKENVNV